MKHPVCRLLLIGLLILAPGTQLVSQEEFVEIVSILERSGAVLEWDEFGRTGILWSGTDSIGFAPGIEVAVLNFADLIRIEPIIYDHGNLLVPDSTATALLDRLGRSQEAARVRPIQAIVIDAGHGGRDPGTLKSVTENGEKITVMEKDIVLDMARRVQQELQSLVNGPQVVLSRSDDTFIELEDRTGFANDLKTDPEDNILFVSLHVNATPSSGWTDARGVEIYYLPPYHRRQVLEDEVAQSLDPEVATILNNLKEDEYTVESVMMGRSVLNAIDRGMPGTPIERGIRVADFFVVREARMPSILIETGFINNQEELALLRSPEYRSQMALSIATGIAGYVAEFEQLR